MAGGGETSGSNYSRKLPGWSSSPSGSPKSKRSKQWIPAQQSPANTTENQQDFHAELTGSSENSPPGSRSGEHSDNVRLLPNPQTPTGQTHDTALPEVNRMGPVSPLHQESAPNPSNRARPYDPRSPPLQTRFHEELGPDEKEDADLREKYSRVPLDCYSTHDPRQSRRSELALAFWLLSLFSTIGSGIWLVTAICQPRWGRIITSGGKLSPSTASLIIALLAKLIETSFVAVFVASVGQLLTKRTFDRKSKGMNLAEISMRNWVVQPGLMITDGPAVRHAALSVLGFVCLLATMVGMLYTTASDALVSPKLKFGPQEEKILQSFVTASYANLPFIRESCLVPIKKEMDSISNDACLAVSLSGASYHNFQSFMTQWHDNPPVVTAPEDAIMAKRPAATSILFDNTTMTAAWIEGQYSNPESSFATHNRVVNNVTLAMPHPGVYFAATDPINNILQPNDLSGVGEYEIQASAVSPAVNVLCANMQHYELAPLVYTTWPNANKTNTFVLRQEKGWYGWATDVPVVDENEWLNRTVVDDIFRWGQPYGRRPPVFPMYPADFNLINNATVWMSDAMYILGKSNRTDDYTLCEIRSWLSPKCSTQFNISGTAGAHMRAHCEDDNDNIRYSKLNPDAPTNATSTDWMNLADEWNLALYMNAGQINSNASRDRILTQFILTEPKLSNELPSFAEGLAVLVSSTLVAGSLHTSLRHNWDHSIETLPAPGLQQSFSALMRTQEYTSSYNNGWQAAFYVVLAGVFLLNILCLVHFAGSLKGRPLIDYTDPPNLFAMAINSPPSQRLKGSCGGGPHSRQLAVPFRVGYSASTNHYYFEEGDKVGEACKGDKDNKEQGDTNSTTAMMNEGQRDSITRSPANSALVSPISPSGLSDDVEKNSICESESRRSPEFARSYAKLANSRSWL